MGRKIFNACMFIFMMFIITTMIAFCVHKYADTIDSIFNENVEITQNESIDSQEIDTLTVQEVLDYRKEALETIRVDSIFLTMPEPILKIILENFGTELSNHEIVYIYESNKTLYSKLKSNQ